MKTRLLAMLLSIVLGTNAQNYTFSMSTGTYSDLTGHTILENSDWDYIERGIQLPFTFKYWGLSYTDSIYVDDFGSISLDINFREEISFLNEDLNSNGNGRSTVSFKIEGTAPERIFKLEYKNVGFNLDAQRVDSANVQCWIYETTHIIEYRYGPNKVKPSSWAITGALVGMVNEDLTKFIILEGNPANPTKNTTDIVNSTSLNGMPANGTIYRFTPTNSSELHKNIIKIDIIGNSLVIPASVQFTNLKLYNTSGQLINSYVKSTDLNLSELNQGLYILVLETNEGVIAQKLTI